VFENSEWKIKDTNQKWTNLQQRGGIMEIIGSTRSTIRIEVDGRTTTLTGEGMPPGGAVHFYADLASIRQWDDGTQITDAERERIVRELPETAGRSGFVVVID
jgi:hypothetical protein